MAITQMLVGGAGAAALSAAGVYLYAAKVEARNFKIEHVTATVNGGTSGRRLKVLHLSDLHLAQPESDKLRFLSQVPSEQADIAIITGDIFENETGLQYADKILRARPKYGAYAVLGNHDYFAYTMFNKTVGRLIKKHRHPPVKREMTPFVEALAAANIQTLRHEDVYLPEPHVHLVGVDYPGTTAEHLRELAGKAPEGALRVVLFHVPKRLAQYQQAGWHFGFAGHTHGGQIRIPGLGAIITESELPRHEASGLIQRGDLLLHVSRGLGADPKSNFRLFCPPHVSFVEIHY